MDLGLKDKVVLITGASRGLGESTARAFAEAGSRVCLVARREEELAEIVKSLPGGQEKHAWLAIDLLEAGAPEKTVQYFEEKFGNINILVNNVGGSFGARDPLSPVSDWEAAWKFNVGIAISINNILVPKMQEQKWGRVVHVSSISANHLLGNSLYAVTKAFLKNYSTVLGRTVAKDGVVVSTIMPGAFNFRGSFWDTVAKDDPKKLQDFLENHMTRRKIGSADEVAPFILFLASEQASFANAAEVNIDGGTV